MHSFFQRKIRSLSRRWPMSEALEMAIRSYYGPLTGLILFAVFLQTNQLLTRREKNLFACELTVVGMMLLATSVDACVS